MHTAGVALKMKTSMQIKASYLNLNKVNQILVEVLREEKCRNGCGLKSGFTFKGAQKESNLIQLSVPLKNIISRARSLVLKSANSVLCAFSAC